MDAATQNQLKNGHSGDEATIVINGRRLQTQLKKLSFEHWTTQRGKTGIVA